MADTPTRHMVIRKPIWRTTSSLCRPCTERTTRRRMRTRFILGARPPGSYSSTALASWRLAVAAGVRPCSRQARRCSGQGRGRRCQGGRCRRQEHSCQGSSGPLEGRTRQGIPSTRGTRARAAGDGDAGRWGLNWGFWVSRFLGCSICGLVGGPVSTVPGMLVHA